jgi:hypothetical protein
MITCEGRGKNPRIEANDVDSLKNIIQGWGAWLKCWSVFLASLRP